MHIVWINNHANLTGGCEHYIFETVLFLKQLGHRCTLLYDVDGPVDAEFTAIFDGAFVLVDINIQLIKLNPDVVYVHQLDSVPAFHALHRASVPVVRFFHDHKLFCLREHKYTTLQHATCQKAMGLGCYRCLGFLNKTPKGIRVRTLSQAEKLLQVNRKFDHFVVGSRYMAHHIALHGFAQRKITVAPLFVKQDDHTGLVQKIEKRVHRNTLNLLFVGQLIRGKGLDILLRALAALPQDVHLTVCGTGRMSDEYEAQTRALGLLERVSFVGQQTSESLRQFYAQCDVVVIPARAPETFCRVGLEALLHGKPVVASNVGGMGDWFKPNVNGLECQPNDVDSLVNSVRRLYERPTLRRELENNIASEDLSRFTAMNHAQVLLTTFESLMEAS